MGENACSNINLQLGLGRGFHPLLFTCNVKSSRLNFKIPQNIFKQQVLQNDDVTTFFH